MDLRRIEIEFAHRRTDLDAWLADAYGGMEDRRYSGERDACYDKWRAIESLVGVIFDRRLTQQLSQGSIDSLLFFISRSDECAQIIAWLASTTGTPFSCCGNLTYPDFLFLCEHALARTDDYCDYQLVACFPKCESLDDRAIGVLQRFFDKADSYTRRRVLSAFEHFALPQTPTLAAKLWQSDNCEFAKLSCLHALKKFPEAKTLFDMCLQEYQNAFDVEAEEYRRSHMRQLVSPDAT